jgi:hypothetical protein
VESSGLKLSLVAGESGLDKSIKGIHLSDLSDPTPYMISKSVGSLRSERWTGWPQ